VPTYKEMPALISKRIPFRGVSVSARWDNDEYQVISFNTKIASIDDKWSGVWWINKETYSCTTSRIQNIVRKIAAEEYQAAAEKRLKKISNNQ